MKRSSAALRQRLRKRVSVFHLPSPVDCAHLDNNISNGINGERLGALEPMPAFKPPTSRLDRCLRLGGGSVSWHRANVLCHAGPESTGSRRLLWQSMCTACVRCVVATLVRGGPHNHAASAATCRLTAGGGASRVGSSPPHHNRFYWFVESQGSPADDPLVLCSSPHNRLGAVSVVTNSSPCPWLCCVCRDEWWSRVLIHPRCVCVSCIMPCARYPRTSHRCGTGLLTEHGPFAVDPTDCNKLQSNPYSWNTVANVYVVVCRATRLRAERAPCSR